MDPDQAALNNLIVSIQSLFETDDDSAQSDAKQKLDHLFENAKTTDGMFNHLERLTINTSLSDMVEQLIQHMENLAVMILTLSTINGDFSLADSSIEKATSQAEILTKTVFSGVDGLEQAIETIKHVIRSIAKRMHKNITSKSQQDNGEDKVALLRGAIQTFREYCIKDYPLCF